MLKGRGRDPRTFAPAHATGRPGTINSRAPLAKPEPDYEVVEFPTENYVNAKLQPPPPPPRPPQGQIQQTSSCGLCGGGGARVRCAECGPRALCASCDDMYHRHPKRRHHQRQALPLSSNNVLRVELPPLPPKATPPVPPPRRHKISGDRSSASPRLPAPDQRRSTIGTLNMVPGLHVQTMTRENVPFNNHIAPQVRQQMLPHQVNKMPQSSAHLGSMPYLPPTVHHANPVAQPPNHVNTMGHLPATWNRPRGSLSSYNVAPNMGVPIDTWEGPDSMSHHENQSWARPLRRGASVLELGGGGGCAGCAGCSGAAAWRYSSCADLHHPLYPPGWPQPPPCCVPHPPQTMHPHPHQHAHPPRTPQLSRRVVAAGTGSLSRLGSRAASPACSVRSRASRRTRLRSPSPPRSCSSDADSESDGRELEHTPQENDGRNSSLGPAPVAADAPWQCEHCTFVNEAGVRVCAVCCRTPTAAPRLVPPHLDAALATVNLADDSPPPDRKAGTRPRPRRNSETKSLPKQERTSTGCGPSPPRDENISKKHTNHLVTPTREQSTERLRRHDMAVGPSPPKDVQSLPKNDTRSSPQENKVEPQKHSVSVGSSPPRTTNTSSNIEKKSTGTSPPRESAPERRSSVGSTRSKSHTGTSPPPQSISTQTYEAPSTWERAPSEPRSRPRRRPRDERRPDRRERSHSRHSLSSETRESERSARTVGGRWEWREPRDSSPGDWSGSERRRGPSAASAARLTRRASHLDLRRHRNSRNSAYYGSGAASPEPLSSNRALSLEALVAAESKREAERGLELARLMAEAEKLGYNAAEVQAALVQSPAAPLAWLRTRWAGLTAGVRAAAARLAPDARITERQARAALARHRGAMWPAVTECVDAHRQQVEEIGVGQEGRVRGHVWGPPTGADDDAAPPQSSRALRRPRAEDSSDEFDLLTQTELQDDQWMYLPNDTSMDKLCEIENNIEPWHKRRDSKPLNNTEDIVNKLKSLLRQSGVPTIDDNLLLKGLMANRTIADNWAQNNYQAIDLGQSENDFIDAYNALTRSSPLPNIVNNKEQSDSIEINQRESKSHNSYDLQDRQYSNKKLDNTSIQSKQMLSGHLELQNHSIKPSQNVEKSKENERLKDEKQDNSPSNNELNTKIQMNSSPTLQDSAQTPLTATDNDISINREIVGNERSNNLKDIFGDTQKLIQQMKEEITSDINSLDGVSHSDGENSSNIDTSEHETTYSESEDESDDISSDDKRSSHSQGFNQNHSINRTSSEDTEQFEEAIDQFEDYQRSNIEMLNSIARSLQEEHIVTVDQTHTPNSLKTQDLNNNFEVVNSFEEIYEELKTTEKNNSQQITQISVPEKPNVHHSRGTIFKSETQKETESHKLPPNKEILKTKQEITWSSPKLESALNLIITERKYTTYKAELENVQSTENFVEIQNKDETRTNNGFRNPELFNLKPENSTISEIDQNSVQVIKQNEIEDVSEFVTTENLLYIDELQNAENINLNTANTTDLSDQNNILAETENNEQNSSEDTTPEANPEASNQPHQNIPNNDEDFQETNADSMNNTVIVSTNKKITLLTNENSTDNESQPFIQSDRNKTSPDTDNSVTVDKSFSKTSPVKSSIPKLIKVLQNNKPKVDKAPKLIASKVPVRRSSLKQYPAPAPPKTKFGNIQIGHVKQLQTRLFSKPLKSVTDTTTTMAMTVSEVKPSTSIAKKKQAPLPPPVLTQGQELKIIESATLPSSPKESPKTKKKRPYFRETCGTDDDWTESETEDISLQTLRPAQESKQTSPPPPPPLTLRRVSGQLIDLANVRLAEGSPERQARMLLAEGAMERWEQARLAVELAARGTELPAALLAALECPDLTTALTYLQQDCELCASRYPEHEMVSMLRCVHRCCRECARHYFTVQVTERSIADCVCPYCKEPELETLPEDAWLEYFAHLDILLKTLLETDVHELFQRKLRDRTLARDPNFRWCVDCSSGFFVHPKHKRLRCPECRSVSCAKCRKPWTGAHEGLSCEQYAVWLDDNDQDRAVAAVQQHLKENGLDCPRCHFRYSLSRGGCMHFTCTQCKYEFCYGCGKPFMMGAQCGLSDYCAKLGLHAHHPRNCLFYLRDKEPHELQTLLQMNNVSYETEVPEGGSGRCPVQLQRETPGGLVDGVCGNDVPPKHAGLCKAHYVEYLAGLARPLDPIPIMEVSELVAELRRRALPLPDRGPWDTDPVYAGMCAEIVKEKIPLD